LAAEIVRHLEGGDDADPQEELAAESGLQP